jgi:hypothetical protein
MIPAACFNLYTCLVTRRCEISLCSMCGIFHQVVTDQYVRIQRVERYRDLSIVSHNSFSILNTP